MELDELLETLRRIEALHARTAVPGERQAAAAALEVMRARLARLVQQDPPVEFKFTMSDDWSRRLFKPFTKTARKPKNAPKQPRSKTRGRLRHDGATTEHELGTVVHRPNANRGIQTFQCSGLDFDSPVVARGFAVDHAPGTFPLTKRGAQRLVGLRKSPPSGTVLGAGRPYAFFREKRVAQRSRTAGGDPHRPHCASNSRAGCGS